MICRSDQILNISFWMNGERLLEVLFLQSAVVRLGSKSHALAFCFAIQCILWGAEK